MAVIIDGTGHVLGRLSSEVAKRILRGGEIGGGEPEKNIVTGERGPGVSVFLARREGGSPAEPMGGDGPP